MAKAKLCAVEGCGKPAYVRVLCTTHYQRWKKHGDPLLGGWPRKTVCETLGCDKPVLARGLCNTHYAEAGFRPDCSVDGCHRKAVAKGLCSAHRRRERRNGSPHATQRLASGEYLRWLEDHASFDGGECLTWPYGLDKDGYGPSRLMCVVAHGEPPTPEHQSAHSCGNGQLGCVHPKHLRWATRLENASDMVEHGRSQRGRRNCNSKLTEQQVSSIRKMIGKASQRSLADMFGVQPPTIRDIWQRRTWAWLD